MPSRRSNQESSASCRFLAPSATSLAAASGSNRPVIRRASSHSTSGWGPHQAAFHANLVHYNWHWFWDFGNGDIGNQGVHEMDKARWLIPAASAGAHGSSATLSQVGSELGRAIRISRSG